MPLLPTVIMLRRPCECLVRLLRTSFVPRIDRLLPAPAFAPCAVTVRPMRERCRVLPSLLPSARARAHDACNRRAACTAPDWRAKGRSRVTCSEECAALDSHVRRQPGRQRACVEEVQLRHRPAGAHSLQLHDTQSEDGPACLPARATDGSRVYPSAERTSYSARAGALGHWAGQGARQS